MIGRYAFLITASLLASSASLGSDTFECGTHIISVNEHVMCMLEHCGEATQKSNNQWIYARGERQFITIVTIRVDLHRKLSQ